MDYCIPEMGEGIYEVELVEWLVDVGQHVCRGDALAEVMTDKASIELPAPFTGTIETLFVAPGNIVQRGQRLLCYNASSTDAQQDQCEVVDTISMPRIVSRAITDDRTAETVDERSRATGIPRHPRRILAAPAVRRMARALGIRLDALAGSGAEGRILLEDLGRFVRTRSVPGGTQRPKAAQKEVGQPGQRLPLQGLRRSIAEHMVTAKKVIPHYSYVDECDVSKLNDLRNRLKRPLYASGVKLTNVPFFVKAVVAGLQQVPIVNASLDDEAGQIVVHREYHVGIATATARGLLVPVVRDADKKNVAEIAAELERLVRSAQAGTIARSDLQGSTFTISSVGSFGGLVSTPIIHHPEVAIVAIGRVFKRPMYDEQGAIVPAHIAYLSFSFDHRVIDGSVGAMFGNVVIQALQNPESLAEGVRV